MDETPLRKVRSACDACHGLKMKCSGGEPCTGCARSGQPCIYSEPHRLGRPKGSKNKKSPGMDKSKSDRNRTKTLDTASVGEARLSETATAMSSDLQISPGNGICSPSGVHSWNNLMEENFLTDLDDNAFLSNLSTSDFSWDQPSDIFDRLESESGMGGYEPDSSMLSLVRSSAMGRRSSIAKGIVADTNAIL